MTEPTNAPPGANADALPSSWCKLAKICEASERNTRRQSGNDSHCSFCGKSQHDVRWLIAGPAVFICDECTGLCADILAEKLGAVPGRLGGIERAHVRLRAFEALKGWGWSVRETMDVAEQVAEWALAEKLTAAARPPDEPAPRPPI